MRTLDEFVAGADLGIVDLVKLDTEGTEPQVLEGSGPRLRRHRPVISCEILPDRGTDEVLEAVFGSLGYRYYLLRSDGSKSMDRVRTDEMWWNWLLEPTAGSEAGKQARGGSE